MSDYLIKVSYVPEAGGWIAEIPDLPVFMAFGTTPVEAIQEARMAQEAWLQEARESGHPIPEPRGKPVLEHRKARKIL